MSPLNDTPSTAPLTAAFDKIFESVCRSDTPGLVVGVRHRGQTLYRRGFGLASIEHGTANTPWTRMRIGSTTKHFACLAALMLAEEGKLDLDTGVRRYLPQLPTPRGEPSLRQFMNHTSGIRCFLDVGTLADGTAVKPAGVAVAMQLRQTDANFAPGENMIYCNGGYHLLSRVIEQVSGMPFARVLDERIFRPMGMRDTLLVPSDLDIHPGMATLHLPVPTGAWRRGIFPSEDVLGEGGIVSTVDDMLLWLAHLRAPRKMVGSEAAWQQMLTLTTLNNGLSNPYGLGLMRHDYRGVEVIHHAGGVVGGTCQMLTVPQHELDIIIMTNGSPLNPMEAANKIVDAVVGEAGLQLLQPRATVERFRPMLGSRYVGSESGLVIGFEDAGEGRLGLSLLAAPPVPLRDEGDTLRVGFEDMAAGPVVLQTHELAQGTDALPAALSLSEAGRLERVELLPATPPALAELAPRLVGRYHAVDLGADAIVRLEGERLVMEVLGDYGRHVMPLEPWSDRVFSFEIVEETPPMKGVLSSEHRGGGVATALVVNIQRTRHLRFERLVD